MGKNIQSDGTQVIDLTGQKFNRLTVIGFKTINKYHQAVWDCKCDCGQTTSVTGYFLTSGHTKSCGCLRREKSSEFVTEKFTKHGLHEHPLYTKWKLFRQRCNNPKTKDYKNYGGRGITVCEEWNDFYAFYKWAISHGWKDGLTIDRIDNNSGYSPENCRFVSAKEQVRNRRKTVYLVYDGVKKPLSVWCEELGLNMKTCYGRLHSYGWENPREILFGKGA